MKLEHCSLNEDVPALEGSQGDGSSSFQAVGRTSRYAWTCCASMSLLTSRYILVDLNLHYPFHLLLIHLVAALSLDVYFQRSRKNSTNKACRQSLARERALRATSVVLMALSMPFTVQAILHMPSLSTLAMFPVKSLPFQF
jgi:hypothetical protein